jgi:hypothetical protein
VDITITTTQPAKRLTSSGTVTAHSSVTLKVTEQLVASDKLADEDWSAYARRSCEEVLTEFNRCLRETDFKDAAGKFGTSEVDRAPDLHWMFNAYFITEPEFQSLNFGR